MEPIQGYLEIMDRGFGFLRSIEKNYQPEPEDPYVSIPLINRFDLREGSFIVGEGESKGAKNKNLALVRVHTVNGLSLDEYTRISLLQEQTSINPMERYTMCQGPEDTTGKALDLIVPIGKGQRGLIISPPKSGKTTILRHMANSIILNHPKSKVFVLLVDERPEEVTDFRRGLREAQVFYSSADQQISHHMRMTRLAMHNGHPMC